MEITGGGGGDFYRSLKIFLVHFHHFATGARSLSWCMHHMRAVALYMNAAMHTSLLPG